MKLIVGLGNPGEKYKKTRHNAGFFVVDALSSCYSSAGKTPEVGSAETSGVKEAAGENFACFKPQTGMNSSGNAVKREVEKKDADLDNLLVVHDDLDIELGEYKLQKAKGAAGHNGVLSVIDYLGSNDFWRLRVGIGRPPESIDPAEYVLEEFTKNELQKVESLIEDELIPVVMEWLSDD